jgi:hypothetical protein
MNFIIINCIFLFYFCNKLKEISHLVSRKNSVISKDDCKDLNLEGLACQIYEIEKKKINCYIYNFKQQKKQKYINEYSNIQFIKDTFNILNPENLSRLSKNNSAILNLEFTKNILYEVSEYYGHEYTRGEKYIQHILALEDKIIDYDPFLKKNPILYILSPIFDIKNPIYNSNPDIRLVNYI